MEDHVLIISKVLYGLWKSGKQFHEGFADTLHIEGFTPCKADSDVWMRFNSDTYEYVAVYVDNISCAMKDPRSFLDHLIKVHKYILNGDEPLSFHLGCHFAQDPDGTCYYQPNKCIRKMLSTYECMFPGRHLRNNQVL